MKKNAVASYFGVALDRTVHEHASLLMLDTVPNGYESSVL